MTRVASPAGVVAPPAPTSIAPSLCRLGAHSFDSLRRVIAALAALAASPAPVLPGYINGTNGAPDSLGGVPEVLIFLGIPAAVFLVIGTLALRQRAVGAVAYRPGRPWGFARVWFGREPAIKDVGVMPAPLDGAGGASGRW